MNPAAASAKRRARPFLEPVVNRKTLFAGVIGLAAALGLVMLVGCNQDSSTAAAGTGNKSVAITSDDRTLGNPNAPIQFVEYAAPSCPHCAHFNEEVFPFLKANYIDTGKVYYIFRVFPIGPQDIPAEQLARCEPKASYFAFIDMLFRQQQVWDPEYGITNVQAGLIQVANAAGMSQDKAMACMQNKAEEDRINKSAQDAVTKYNLNSTPSFVINGTVRAAGFDQDSLKKFLDALLSKK
ncbi:MAG TPA: DsbA family protein [Rhizomicrobium sp.]